MVYIIKITLDDLPEEIVMHIFSYMSFETLALINQVCTLWYQLSKESELSLLKKSCIISATEGRNLGYLRVWLKHALQSSIDTTITEMVAVKCILRFLERGGKLRLNTQLLWFLRGSELAAAQIILALPNGIQFLHTVDTVWMEWFLSIKLWLLKYIPKSLQNWVYNLDVPLSYGDLTFCDSIFFNWTGVKALMQEFVHLKNKSGSTLLYILQLPCCSGSFSQSVVFGYDFTNRIIEI